MSMFHERLNYLKSKSGKTQVQIADELGITPQNLSYYINGREPGYDLLIKMADMFSVSLDYLVGRIDVETSEIDHIAISEKLGLTIESIEILQKCYKDWPDNSVTRTINALIKDENVLFNIGQYLFYKLGEKVIPITLIYDKGNKKNVFYADEGLKGHYVDSFEMTDGFDEERLKKIILFEIQTYLEKLLKDLSTKE